MFKNYFTTAWRHLIKNKTYSLLNILGLTIGVVVCLLIGVWLQRETSFDNFHPNSNKIFRIANTFKSESETFSQAPSGVALGAQLPKQLSSIKAACRVFRFENKFKVGNNQFFEENVLDVDSNFFTFFGFRLAKGLPAQVLHAPDQLVITAKTALKYFGTTQGVIGKTMLMEDSHPMTIAGIAEDPPPNSHLRFDILVPYAYLRLRAIQNWKQDLDNSWVGGWPYVYVQLADPAKWRETEKQINAVVEKFSEKEWKENKMSYRYFLQPVQDIHLRSHLRYDAPNNGSSTTINIFSIVGIIVLLLACINYINLTTAGAIKRAKETSVRKVVGATKSQLIGQFFLETFIICTVAVVAGVVTCKAILPAFSAWIEQPYNFPLSPANILIIVTFIILMAVIAGIYPSAILSSFNPAVSLKGNFLQSRRGNIIRKSLVVFQFTITIALIASILIISRQMSFIKHRSLGFNGNAVLEVNFNGDDNVIQRYGSLRNELLKSPYVLDVTKHDANIVGGLGNGWTTTTNAKGEEVSTSIYRLSVDADYFDTYEMKLAAGRFFSKDIPTDTAKAVLVNEAAVRTFGWQRPENALGKPFGKGNDIRYVIGVVKDFNFESLHKKVEALLIGYTKTDNGSSMSLKIDAAHIHEAIDHLTKTWKNTIPDVPMQYSFVDDRIAEQYGNERKMEGVFYGFSGLSLLIACLGLFGLSTFVVERKIKEIGIRKVLGASVSGIVGLLSEDFVKLVLLSVLIASPLAWYFMRHWLQNFAYHITIGWWEFAAAGMMAVLIALTTVSIQSIKAATANPVKSLRTE
jgi:putative ABC transport system permease protein